MFLIDEPLFILPFGDVKGLVWGRYTIESWEILIWGGNVIPWIQTLVFIHQLLIAGVLLSPCGELRVLSTSFTSLLFRIASIIQFIHALAFQGHIC